MAIYAPSHGLILGLVNNFHLIDPTVTGNARNATIYVSRVIKVNEVGQTVNPDPVYGFTRSPTIVNRFEFFAVRVYRRQRRRPTCRGLSRSLWAVTIYASLGWRNGGMSGFVNRIMTVAAVHLQFASVQSVAERHGLLRTVPGIERDWAGSA